MQRMVPLLAFALVAASALLASSGENDIEIDQFCARESGCFSGDTPGFPVTIDGSAGNHYVLMSGLLIPDENTTAIEIAAPDIDLDMNGHHIVGVTRCAQELYLCSDPTLGPPWCQGPLACQPVGSGRGVTVVSASQNYRVRIHSGRVKGMGDVGIAVGDHGSVEAVYSESNGRSGIVGSRDAYFDGNTTVRNGEIGISARQAATVVGSTSFENGSDGFRVGARSFLLRNRAYENAASGIHAGANSELRGNQANRNGSRGITAASDSRLIRNTVANNGSKRDSEERDGISCESGCTLRRNGVGENGGAGIRVGDQAELACNSVRRNRSHGVVAGQGSEISGNSVYENGGMGLNIRPKDVSQWRNSVTDNSLLNTRGVPDSLAGEDASGACATATPRRSRPLLLRKIDERGVPPIRLE